MPIYVNKCKKCGKLLDYIHTHPLKTRPCDEPGCGGSAVNVPAIPAKRQDATVHGYEKGIR